MIISKAGKKPLRLLHEKWKILSRAERELLKIKEKEKYLNSKRDMDLARREKSLTNQEVQKARINIGQSHAQFTDSSLTTISPGYNFSQTGLRLHAILVFKLFLSTHLVMIPLLSILE